MFNEIGSAVPRVISRALAQGDTAAHDATRQAFFAPGQTAEEHRVLAAAKVRADVLAKGGSLEDAARFAALVARKV